MNAHIRSLYTWCIAIFHATYLKDARQSLSLPPSLPLFWWKHTIISLNVCENTIDNGCHNRVWRKEFLLAPKKKIVTLVLPSTFVDMLWVHAYHQNKSIAHISIMCDPQYLKNRRTIAISNFESTCVNYANTLSSCQITAWQNLPNFKKCNSKSNKQTNIVWNNEYYLPIEQCKRSNCVLLIHVTLELMPKANPQ